MADLDARPIIDRIEGRGGLAVALGYDDADTRRGAALRGEPRTTPMSADPEWRRITRQWHRMRKSGRVSLALADEWCCQILRINPALVYGAAWWDDLEEATA